MGLKRQFIASAALAAFIATPAAASTIFAPTGATIDTGGPGHGAISQTFDQSGLAFGYISGATNFDFYTALNPLHSRVFHGNEWFSNVGETSAQVTYDLGDVVGFDRVALWNEETAGIGTLELLASADGNSFSSLGTFALSNSARGFDYGAEVLSFDATSARYVRFAMSDCPQPNSRFDGCSIGEVALRSAQVMQAGAVPEPATWAMMLLGFFGLGGALRRTRGKAGVSARFA